MHFKLWEEGGYRLHFGWKVRSGNTGRYMRIVSVELQGGRLQYVFKMENSHCQRRGLHEKILDGGRPILSLGARLCVLV